MNMEVEEIILKRGNSDPEIQMSHLLTYLWFLAPNVQMLVYNLE